MCLVTEQVKAKKATEDIVCYKVVKVIERGDMKYYVTPYRGGHVELGQLVNSDMREETYGGVEIGLHSYEHLHDAINEANDWKSTNNEYFLVVEALIPAGSKYYSGYFHYEHAYASNKLQYTDKILHSTCV